jgi:class 3 adenylate cyclase
MRSSSAGSRAPHPHYGKRRNRASIPAMNSGRERVERRVVAILAADVAGYSRLMGADPGAAEDAHPVSER